MASAIECVNVTRVFGSRNPLTKKQQVKALDGLDLNIPQGIVFSLLGPNGSGKTTTIRIVSTLLTPTSGKAKVLDFDCVKEAGKVREKIGLILGGDRGLFGRLTGVENLNYFAALNGMSRAEAGKRLKEIIEMVGLTTSIDRPVEQYSRGMKQRLHIARGLLTDPVVLLMDEPTIGLDPQGALELRQLIPKLTEQGKTILLTTHYMAEADALSSQIAIINKGKIIAAGTPTAIKHSFSKISILEVILRQVRSKVTDDLAQVRGIERVSVVTDGPLQRLTLHVLPGVDVQPEVKRLLDERNIDYLAGRDPTLEEAYLSIIK